MPRIKPWENLSHDEKIERWEKGVKVLQKLPAHVRKKHWDMSTFGINTQCGTVACAAGHIGMDPWFRARGLSLRAVGGKPLEKSREGAGASPGYVEKVRNFFGDHGTDTVFMNPDRRNVTRVIREMKLFIEVLKAEKAYDQAAEALDEAEADFNLIRI